MREPITTRITRHFLPSEARVLGVQLSEFTLWHWAKLAAYELPAADLQYSEDFSQFATAVRICASKPNNDPFTLRMRWWERQRWKYKARIYEPILVDEEEVFMEWIDYHLKPPARWHKEGSSEIQCPPWIYLSTRLIVLGFRPDEAWACTPGRARCYLAADDVYHGGGDFVSEEEIHGLLTDGGYTEEQLGLS